MFNFKTDFLNRPKIGQIIEKNEEVNSKDPETSSQLQVVEQQESEPFFSDPDRVVYQEVDAFPVQPDTDEQEQEPDLETKAMIFYPEDECKGIPSTNIIECTNTPENITGLLGGVVAKIPAVLSELNIQVNVDSIISIPEQALEIKEIIKRVKLTQCLLLQDPDQVIPSMLFLKGFIRKNIAYATKNCSNQEGICGDIHHCTVDVPFSCTTRVTFNGADPLTPMPNTIAEFQYFRREDLSDRKFPEKDELLSSDFSEFNQVTEEFYNELPYCELVSARIVEYNELIPFEEEEFFKIEEKVVLLITVKILQNQQVQIPATTLPTTTSH